MSLYKSISKTSLIALMIYSCQSPNIDNSNNQKSHNSTEPLSERAPKVTASLHRPFDFPLVLSGNFGELRANHFHSGIDFKTQGETKKPIHCAYDGYVSHISVSGGGYGRAIYVTHPSIGLTTVYAHIEQFSPKIDSITRAEQYRRETFAIDLEFPIDSIPVSRGEIIALSGNSGHSFGPHLHMEVRHTATGDAIDPLPYFKSLISDSVAPQAHKLALYPDKYKGRVNNSRNAAYFNITSNSEYFFNAWGMVYPAICANDYMSNTHNVYGVKYLTLIVDGKQVYKRIIDRFQFEATRAINTLVNYSDLTTKGEWNMHTCIPKSQPLGCMIETSLHNGAININAERDYKCEYILADEYGNKSVIPFTIHGVATTIEEHKYNGKLITQNEADTMHCSGMDIRFFKGCFYDDCYVAISKKDNSKYHSPIYSIGNNEIPLGRTYRIAINIDNDKIGNKSNYLIVRVGKNGNRAYKSLYKNGQVIAYVDRFGDYAITTDNNAPNIVPINSNKWETTGTITYRLTDNLSGVKSYRGEIDGKWVMFEADTKNSLISFNLDSKYVYQNNKHNVTIIATDFCGNRAQISNNFYW